MRLKGEGSHHLFALRKIGRIEIRPASLENFFGGGAL